MKSGPLDFKLVAQDGHARAGVVTTSRGTYETPCFMPVGTRGAVKTLSADDYDVLKPQVVLGNTYHLMLRPGADVVESFGGLHAFTGYDGHYLTDSGGFQVFSLAPKQDADGVTFRSTYDGSSHRFTPAKAVAVQEQIGADIAMVLDICPPLPSTPQVVLDATNRTHDWAQRCRDAHTRDDQAQFGIVQGGIDPQLRAQSAATIAAIGFEGHGIGGLSVGESREEMLPALAGALSELPTNKPRYLMGVGDPLNLIDSIALGVDQFDCVLPTRLARHGTILSSHGRQQLRRAENLLSDEPLDPLCGCPVCVRHSRGYLRHLHVVGEPTAARLLTMHNLWYVLRLVETLRNAIVAGQFESVAAELRVPWLGTSTRTHAPIVV
jgi:queuine tRNA-ribosyltransferase